MHIKRVWCLSLLDFLKNSFKFQPNVCNRCHDLQMMFVNLSDIAILNIEGSDYCYIISLICKNEAINFYKMLIWLKTVEHYKLEKQMKK